MGCTRLKHLSSSFLFPSLVIAFVVGGGGVIAVIVVDATVDSEPMVPNYQLSKGHPYHCFSVQITMGNTIFPTLKARCSETRQTHLTPLTLKIREWKGRLAKR